MKNLTILGLLLPCWLFATNEANKFKRKKLALLMFGCLTAVVAKADVGCRLSNGNVYPSAANTAFRGAGVYEKSPSVNVSSTFCGTTSSEACYVRTSVYAECPNCPLSYSDFTFWYNAEGTIYYYSTVNCPLDDYAIVILLLSCGFGYLLLKGCTFCLVKV